MTALTSLDLAIDVATRLRDRTLQQLARAEQAKLAAEQQQEQLQSYAQETQHRWTLRTKAPTGQPLLHHYHHFVDRLHVTMDLQCTVIQDQKNSVLAAQAALRSAEQRLHGLVRYRERLALQAQSVALRAEQKQWDEIALLMLGRSAKNPLQGGQL